MCRVFSRFQFTFQFFLEDKYSIICLPSPSPHHTTLIQQIKSRCFPQACTLLQCTRIPSWPQAGCYFSMFQQISSSSMRKSQKNPYCHLDCRRGKRCTPNYRKHFKHSLEIRSRFLTANDMIGSFSSLVFCHIQEINTYMNHL